MDTVEWEFLGWTDDLGRIDAARESHRPAHLEVRTPGYGIATRPLVGTSSIIRLSLAPVGLTQSRELSSLRSALACASSASAYGAAAGGR